MIIEEAEVVADWLKHELCFLTDLLIRLIPWLIVMIIVMKVLQVVARQIVLEIQRSAQQLECSRVVSLLYLRVSSP